MSELKMYPFDLDRAKSGDEVCTRNGDKVPFFAYAEGARGSQRCIFMNVHKDFYVAAETGKVFPADKESQHDLFMVDPPPYEPSDEECKEFIRAAEVGTAVENTGATPSQMRVARYALKREKAGQR